MNYETMNSGDEGQWPASELVPPDDPGFSPPPKDIGGADHWLLSNPYIARAAGPAPLWPVQPLDEDEQLALPRSAGFSAPVESIGD